MKTIFVVLLATSLGATLQAQDTTGVSQAELGSSVIEPVVVGPILSAEPSSRELAELFASHEIDVTEAIGRAVAKVDAAVPGLAGLLALTGSGSSVSEMEIGNLVRNKFLSLEALEKIGSSSAFAVLIQTATTESDVTIRALALHKISRPYHNRAKENQLLPDKAVVGILIQNLGDDTFIGTLQKKVSQIAQAGLMRWLGLDFGDPVFSEERARAGGGLSEASTAEYASIWWQANSDNLVWKPETNRFEVKE